MFWTQNRCLIGSPTRRYQIFRSLPKNGSCCPKTAKYAPKPSFLVSFGHTLVLQGHLVPWPSIQSVSYCVLCPTVIHDKCIDKSNLHAQLKLNCSMVSKSSTLSIPDQKRIALVFSHEEVPKLVLSSIKISSFGPKTAVFAYVTIMGQILALVARLMPCPSQKPSKNGGLLVSQYGSTKMFPISP